MLLCLTLFIQMDGLGFTHHQRRHGGDEGEGEDEGPHQSQHDRGPHGNKGLALDAFQHQ